MYFNILPMYKLVNVVVIVFYLLTCFSTNTFCSEVIYAINAGGEAHTDLQGIHYVKDPLTDQDIGTASDFGKNLVILRVPAPDQILYQTERYHFATFGYDLPVRGDGEYVIVLKFAEVYFDAPGQKVFSVQVNGAVLVPDLDIFGEVGRGVAHQVVIPFTLHGRTLTAANGVQTTLTPNNKVKVEFVKGYRDNPKINAVYIMKGNAQDVLPLPPPPIEEEPEREEEQQAQPGSTNKRISSGPRTPDPYNSDESSGTFLPLLAAVGAAVPIVFCLCRM